MVSGSVTRNVGQVSTAEVVLRNRFRKWLKDPQNKQSIFLPMDMITIWLERVGGHPIQVFTGYLDSVPYYQAYPGNCTLQATCTLKKIALSWFDPGLTFFQNIVNDLGWVIDPTTGEAQPGPGKLRISGNDPSKAINDTGFAQLLYEFMVQICNWNPNNVYISNLPPTLPRKAAELYKKINATTDHDLVLLEQLLQQVMGVTFTPDSQSGGALTSTIERTVKVVKKQADNYNIHLLPLLAAGQVLTGFDAKYHTHYIDDPKTWGYGLFGARPTLVERGSQGAIYQEGGTIQGRPIKDLADPSTAAELFCRKLKSVDPKGELHKQANSGSAKAIKQWIELASGRTLTVADFDASLSIAQSWTKTFNTNSGQKNATTVINSKVQSVKHLTWQDSDITDLMNAVERKVYTTQYSGKINKELAPYYFFARNNHPQIELCKRWTSDPTILVLSTSKGTSGGEGLNMVFDSMKNKTAPSLVIRKVQFDHSGVGQGPGYLVHGRQSNGSQHAKSLYDDMPSNSVLIQVQPGAPYPLWDGQKSSDAIIGVQQKNPDPSAKKSFEDNGLSFQDFGKLSLDAAFTAQFAFPVNYIESQFLTGEKALMNDISCLDAVQQFCASSMRAFMSLPNGKFLAFYPDYFGAHGRKPYWQIYDIEILNMGVQLNDEALATHVYVVGDTFSFQDSNLEAFNYIASRGVATLTQASILESLIVPINQHKFGAGEKESAWGRLKDAYAFLQHYGARPYKEDQPLIRNTFYEFLYAWQRFEQKWAQTFNTQVQFTFQPEVMAGGIIEFPQHNLQMFVESVTHTWDYTGGFFTEAVLSSPAAVKDNGLGVGALPGFALAGGVNSVGVGT